MRTFKFIRLKGLQRFVFISWDSRFQQFWKLELTLEKYNWIQIFLDNFFCNFFIQPEDVFLTCVGTVWHFQKLLRLHFFRQTKDKTFLILAREKRNNRPIRGKSDLKKKEINEKSVHENSFSAESRQTSEPLKSVKRGGIIVTSLHFTILDIANLPAEEATQTNLSAPSSASSSRPTMNVYTPRRATPIVIIAAFM